MSLEFGEYNKCTVLYLPVVISATPAQPIIYSFLSRPLDGDSEPILLFLGDQGFFSNAADAEHYSVAEVETFCMLALSTYLFFFCGWNGLV